MIAFDKEGEAIFLRTPPTNEEVEINNLSEKWSINELKDNLSGYLIIAKELSHSEKKTKQVIGSSVLLVVASGSTLKSLLLQWYRTFYL